MIGQNVVDYRQRREKPWRWRHLRGGDATGGGNTLGGSIAVVNGVGYGMGGGCSGCDRSESRGIGQGSQLVKSSRSLVISKSCSRQILAGASFTVQERKLRAWAMRLLSLTVGWER